LRRYTSPILKSRASTVGLVLVLGFVLLVALGPLVYRVSPYVASGSPNLPPSLANPLGTDYLGQDILAEIIQGGQVSMLTGILAAIGASVLGVLVGLIGGYFDKLESLLGGATSVIMTFPALPLIVLLGSLYPPTIALIVLYLALILWTPVARSIRSQVLSVKHKQYISTCRISGMRSWEIVMKVLLPEISPIAIAYFVLTVPLSIVIVASLEFLGIGNPNIVSWGSILYFAQQFAFYSGDWWWILAPGLSISLVALGFALLGFTLERVANPRLR
jgi:peptide/nickel transport system permease protein